MGRFICADGYASTGQGLLGANMFAYCGNNPVTRIDPSGHCYYDCNGNWRHDNWEYIGGYVRLPDPKTVVAKKGSTQKLYSSSDITHMVNAFIAPYSKNNKTCQLEFGTTGIKINNSYLINDFDTMILICSLIRCATNDDGQLYTQRSVTNLVAEWEVHNEIAYLVPENSSMYVSVASVDLEFDKDPRWYVNAIIYYQESLYYQYYQCYEGVF